MHELVDEVVTSSFTYRLASSISEQKSTAQDSYSMVLYQTALAHPVLYIYSYIYLPSFPDLSGVSQFKQTSPGLTILMFSFG